MAQRVAIVCCRCGCSFEVFPYRAPAAKYCSKACWSDRGARAPCLHCGRMFKATTDRRKYCSHDCSYAHRRGPLASRWKGGASLISERARLSGAIAAWRLTVYRRDGYRCVRCGAGGRLHAHHIRSFAEHPALRTVVANGETLCIACHGAEHGRDFSRRRPPPLCCDCGAAVALHTPPALRCRSCAARHGHATRAKGHRPPEQEPRP